MIPITIEAADGRRWVVSGLSRSARLSGVPYRKVSSLRAMAGSSGDAFVFLENTLRHAFDGSLEILWRDIPQGMRTFIVLVPKRSAPEIDPWYGPPVTSFLC